MIACTKSDISVFLIDDRIEKHQGRSNGKAATFFLPLCTSAYRGGGSGACAEGVKTVGQNHFPQPPPANSNQAGYEKPEEHAFISLGRRFSPPAKAVLPPINSVYYSVNRGREIL